MSEMEYKNLSLVFLGMTGFLFWAAEFLHLFKRPQIYIPKKYLRKRMLALRSVLFIAGIVAWTLISISLAGPRKPLGHSPNIMEVNDIFLVVDVSASMQATDFRPNRIEAAKEKIYDFISLHPTDRIGIIIFSEKIFTLLPLTTDLELIKRVIPEIKCGFRGVGSGTNIGDAIGLAVARGLQSQAKNKIIVLLTDGASNVGTLTPLEAAQKAAEQHMKIYTIGMGAREDAQMPVTLPSGQVVYQNIPGGSFDLNSLQAISKETGGKSYVAKDEESLKDILLEISRLEKSKIESKSKIIYQELYFKFLLYGLTLFFLVELSRRFVAREVA